MTHRTDTRNPQAAPTMGGMRTVPSDDLLVGRGAEIAVLAGATEKLAAGQGGLLWIEGEPGVGKSTLVRQLTREAQARDCTVRSAGADEFTGRFPLSVMLNCLGVEAWQSDRFSDAVPGSAAAGLRLGSRILSVSDRLYSTVEELCTTSPVMLVVDDLQWVDPESISLWRRLVRNTTQAPLLLVAVLRSGHAPGAIADLKQDFETYGGTVLDVGPLPQSDVEVYVEHLVGTPPGDSLRHVLAQTNGNPLYVRELVTLLMWQDEITAPGESAELQDNRPESGLAALSSVIAKRLDLLPPELNNAVSLAAFLGGSFPRADLTAVLRVEPSEAEGLLQQAATSGVLRVSDSEVSFRHGLMREILYASVPEALRYALHREIAEVLAGLPATPATRVAEQLIAAATADDTWTVDWIGREAPSLLYKAPDAATTLLQRAIAALPTGDARWIPTALSLVTVLFRTDQDEAASRLAKRVLNVTHDVETAAAMRWYVGWIAWRSRRLDDALTHADEGLRLTGVSDLWRGRIQVLRAEILAGGLGDIERGEEAATAAVAAGEAAGDMFSRAYGRSTLFYIHISHRDYEASLASVDAALQALREHDTRRELHDVHMILYDNRMFALQNLDLLDEADATLQQARATAADAGETPMNRLAVQAAIQSFWTGRWDDARAELDAAQADLLEVTNFGLRGHWPVLLMHGVDALVSAHCDPLDAAQEALRAGDDKNIAQAVDRDNCDFLVAARALCAEREGSPEEALRIFAPMTDPEFGRSLLKHQWLPDVVRLAMSVGDLETADRAVEICGSEATRSGTGRARMAAARCVGIRTGRAEQVLGAVDYYRGVGRRVEQAWALEDAAALLAAGDGADQLARQCLREAVEIYDGLGAQWDIERARTRLRAVGVRDALGPFPPKPTSGVAALTPTERSVALCVARGRSIPEIAEELLLSGRTVEVHVSHIMKKLGATSRRELAGALL